MHCSRSPRWPARLSILIAAIACSWLPAQPRAQTRVACLGDSPYHETKAFRDALAWQPNIAIVILGTNDTCEKEQRHNWQRQQDLATRGTILAACAQALDKQAVTLLAKVTLDARSARRLPQEA